MTAQEIVVGYQVCWSCGGEGCGQCRGEGECAVRELVEMDPASEDDSAVEA